MEYKLVKKCINTGEEIIIMYEDDTCEMVFRYDKGKVVNLGSHTKGKPREYVMELLTRSTVVKDRANVHYASPKKPFYR